MTQLLNELKEEIKLHQKTIRGIKEKSLKPVEVALLNAKQAFAEEACFCKVGDKIQEKGQPPVIVSKISYIHNSFSLRVKKIKKNGEVYQNDTSVWGFDSRWDDWKIVI